MANDDRTRTYVKRRRAEGKSNLEIIRALKRYVAREDSARLVGEVGLGELRVIRRRSA